MINRNQAINQYYKTMEILVLAECEVIYLKVNKITTVFA